MQILNIAGYKFIELNDISSLKKCLLDECQQLSLKGTILLSCEGINITLAGNVENIKTFQTYLKNDYRFMDMKFHETYSATLPFRYLKIKLKKEIITFKQPETNPVVERAPSISPQELKQWLDEKRDITLLDTRNNYEINFGSFSNALNLTINDFSELPTAIKTIDRDKPIVMFCTGGIRCEKAAIYMLHQGFSNVYQLDGGILGYFNQIGGDHYNGECFVFDERISVDADLNHSGTVQCKICHQPVTPAQQALLSYVVDVSCPSCV